MSLQYTWIYLFEDEFTGLYKIGKSDNPPQRICQLMSMQTILAAPTDTYQFREAWLAEPVMERTLHEMFAPKRIRGEWFELDDDDLEQLHQHLKQFRRWDEAYTLQEEELRDTVSQYEWELQKAFREDYELKAMLRAMYKQLMDAKLRGYLPPQGLLMPVPAVHLDKPLVDVLDEVGFVSSATIDALEGEIIF